MFLKRIREFIDLQYQLPKGLWGLYFGEKMVLQHVPETIWTIDLLKLKKDERVLEIGCGAGYALKKLLTQSAVHHATGLDVSASILRSAKVRNRHAIKNGRAEFILGNVNDIPLGDELFTKVFSIHSVYFWDIAPETISEIYRVLKPNGTVTITLCNGKSGETWTGVQSMLDEKLIPFMEQAGFKDVKIVKGPDSRNYHTIAVTGEK